MSILLVSNYTKTLAYEAMSDCAIWLKSMGYSVVQATSDKLLAGKQLHDELQADIKNFELVVCFGGDGTILRVAGVIGRAKVPLLGINYGEVGFLSGASPEATNAAIESALAGEASVEKRCLLEFCAQSQSGKILRRTALNEVVLSRSDPGRDITLGLSIDGQCLPDIRGDGLLVATATGSTAYALSAGGPVISPGMRALVLVPLMPRNLAARPIVTGGSEGIRLEYRSRFAQRIILSADGQQLEPTNAEDPVVSVEVKLASEQLLLLRYDNPAFYQRVSEVFFGGECQAR
jgi:NAD+ kinase